MELELTTDRYPTNMQTTQCMCTILKHSMWNYPEMFIIFFFLFVIVYYKVMLFPINDLPTHL